MLKTSLLTFLFSSITYFFSYPEVDPDLWGHLFFGREILQAGSLPARNLYSYTAPHQPWINHEWLAEVVFYLLFRFFGSPGLILFKLALGGGIIWLLDRCIQKQVPSLAVRGLTLVWVMAILSPGFNIRPQLFTYLFFAVLISLFYRYDEGKKATFYWAPLLMILWVNLHGGFAAGLGALGLFSFWAAIDWPWRNAKLGRGMAPLLVLCASVGVLLLNPYGWELLGFLARDLLLDRPITEWQPIPLLDFSFLGFKIAVLFIFLFSLRGGYLRRGDFGLMVLTAILALRYRRHVPLFAIASAPFLAEGLRKLSRHVEEGVGEWMLSSFFLVGGLYLIVGIGRIHIQHQFQLVVSPLEYPTQAVDFLKRNGVRGNLAAPFDWGEYLVWKLYPQVRVSIDGRYTTAYPMEVIQEHWDWMEGKRGWRKLLECYPSEIAITSRYHPVTALMRKDPEWVYIYSDPVAFVFVRKVASQREILDKFRERRLLPPRAPSMYFPG